MKTLRFISDLHLSPERPDISNTFFSYLDNIPKDTHSLYLLGDIFDAYIGDDDDSEFLAEIQRRLLTVSQRGIELYFMQGNRDFLVGEQFCQAIGCTLLPDPSILKHQGKTYLLMHGDSLCTDDAEYQTFRAQIQHPDNKAFLLSKPLEERRAIARQLRESSKSMSSNKAEDIMDVNTDAVAQALAEHQADILIHGHTHRPFVHPLVGDKQRIVLGDWDRNTAWELVITGDSYSLNSFPFTE